MTNFAESYAHLEELDRLCKQYGLDWLLRNDDVHGYFLHVFEKSPVTGLPKASVGKYWINDMNQAINMAIKNIQEQRAGSMVQ